MTCPILNLFQLHNLKEQYGSGTGKQSIWKSAGYINSYPNLRWRSVVILQEKKCNFSEISLQVSEWQVSQFWYFTLSISTMYFFFNLISIHAWWERTFHNVTIYKLHAITNWSYSATGTCYTSGPRNSTFLGKRIQYLVSLVWSHTSRLSRCFQTAFNLETYVQLHL